MTEVQLPEQLVCKKCGHHWVPRSKWVYRCPNSKCMSFRWDEDDREPDKEKAK